MLLRNISKSFVIVCAKHCKNRLCCPSSFFVEVFVIVFVFVFLLVRPCLTQSQGSQVSQNALWQCFSKVTLSE